MKMVKWISTGIVLIATVAIVLGLATGQLSRAHAAPQMSYGHAAVQTTSITPPPGIPAALMVPAGNVLFAQAFGRGVQIYNCPTTAASVSTPFTVLYTNSDQKQVIGTHDSPDGLLRWSDLMGNSVIAVPQVVVPSANPANIPQVLLKAQAHFGPGNSMISNVTFIQRVNPMGGAAPVGGCMGANQAQESIPFTTTYLFYKAAA